MKRLLLFLLATSLISSAQIIWSEKNEQFIEDRTLALAAKLPLSTAIIGRTGLAETRIAVAVGDGRHLLAPHLTSIDGEDAAYLLYQADGSRLTLETVAELPKRFVSLLKLPDSATSLVPVQIDRHSDHTVAIPTLAPIARLGEKPGIAIEHLEFSPPEKVTAFRLDSTLHDNGTPVFDLTGALIGVTLKARKTNTPALMIGRLLELLPELNNLGTGSPTSKNPSLPLAPTLTREERKETETSALAMARSKFAYAKLPVPAPFALIANEGAPSTHSIIGTIIHEDGIILTKASELGPDLTAQFGGKSYPAILLATDKATDLALVGIQASGLPTILWTKADLIAGMTLSSPILISDWATEDSSPPTSAVGTFAQLISGELPTIQATSKVTSLGLITEQINSQLVIAALLEGSSASQAGLQLGDVISKINARPLALRGELIDFLNQQKVGQEVELEVIREEKTLKITLPLEAPHLMPATTGIKADSRVSIVPSVWRGPFPQVLVHSIPLNAWECGSPIFDRDGKAIGINIAVASPNRSFALPVAEIEAALDRMASETLPF